MKQLRYEISKMQDYENIKTVSSHIRGMKAFDEPSYDSDEILHFLDQITANLSNSMIIFKNP